MTGVGCKGWLCCFAFDDIFFVCFLSSTDRDPSPFPFGFVIFFLHKSRRFGARVEPKFACVVVGEKMSHPTQPRTHACSVVVLAMFWAALQRGFSADIRTCLPPCSCSGDLVDCSRLRRGQIRVTFPEWTVQLWVRLRCPYVSPLTPSLLPSFLLPFLHNHKNVSHSVPPKPIWRSRLKKWEIHSTFPIQKGWSAFLL